MSHPSDDRAIIVKQSLASVGLTVLVLLGAIVLAVVACVLGGLLYVWRSVPVSSRQADGARIEARAAGFDGPAWALAHYNASLNHPPAGGAGSGWAPVAAAEFDRLGPSRAELPAAVPVCRVAMQRVAWDQSVDSVSADGRVEERFTGYVAPDPTVFLQVGGEPARVAFAPEDTYEATVAFPLVTLPIGGVLTLRALDRDLAVNDAAGQSTVRYEGHLPLHFQGERFTAECRGVAPARALELAAPSLDALDATLNRFELPTDPGNPDAWALDPRLERVHQSLIRLAAWLGWGHTEVKRRVEQAAILHERLPGQIRAAIRELPVQSNTRLQDTVRLRVTRWSCGSGARARCGVVDDQACVAEIELGRFDGDSPPLDRDRVRVFSEYGPLPLTSFNALGRSRQYCMAFATSGAMPSLLDGTAPALMLVPGASAPLRVQ